MDKQQTSVDWLSNRAYELFEQYSEGNFDRITLNKLMFEATNKAKEMEKEQIINAFEQGENNSVDYFNPENRIKESEHYYNETYGGNK
jgi:hypothetical protein